MQRFFKYLHSDINVKKNSSSGGAFTMISDYIINLGGIVYGCILNNNEAIHIRSNDKKQRDQMRGSKYIQSSIEKILEPLKKDLNNGKTVLFSGTPCQCAAIKKYLLINKINDSNLITVEVICHGVGSSGFFKDYLADKEKRYNSKVEKVSFRGKHRVGQKQDMALFFKNGKEYHASSTKFDWWYSIYLKNLILRPSCYKCKYAQKERVADLSIGDFWGENSKESYSLIVCNTDKGNSIIEKRCVGYINEVEWREVHQPYMISPPAMPDNREEFWHIYLNKGYKEVQRMMGNNTIKGKFCSMFARILYELHLSGAVKRIIKQ